MNEENYIKIHILQNDHYEYVNIVNTSLKRYNSAIIQSCHQFNQSTAVLFTRIKI